MKKHFFLLVWTIISCNSPQPKDTKKDVIVQSPEKVNIIKEPIIRRDSLTCFKIALVDHNYKIISAYYDCGMERERKFNSEKIALDSCNKKLVVENDTIIMFATYGKTGTFKFEDITVLIKDTNNQYSFIDTTFYFTVSEAL